MMRTLLILFIASFYCTSIQGQGEIQGLVQSESVDLQEMDTNPSQGNVQIHDATYLTFHLYPNPAQDYIYIKNPSNDQVRYHILDLTGEKVSEGFIHSEKEQIPLDGFNNGVYLIRLENSRGVKTLRFNKGS